MRLPFSAERFFEVFAAYNAALWPAALVLWLASAATVVALVRGRASDRWLAGLLAVLWAWGGLAYHAAFFSRINPAARLFAALFVIEALVFLGMAGAGTLRFGWGRSPRHGLAAVLLVYALAYPGLALVTGHVYPAMPTFGVPCPTTLFTAGLLLGGRPRVPRWPAVVPVVWSAIGGSAALFFGVTPDLMLFPAGAALAVYAFRPG
jgi:hypothetical protein